MNDEIEHPRQRRPRWPWVVAALYVLSMGPFWGAREHGVLTRGGVVERSLVSFYSPVEWLVQHIPPFKVILKAYLELFGPV